MPPVIHHPFTFLQAVMNVDLLITNGCLLPEAGKQKTINPGFVAIAGNCIAQTGPMEACTGITARTVIDGQGHLVMSGLINCHCHAPMTLFRGMADDLALTSWLNDHIFPAEAKFVTEEMAYWCSKLAAAEMLLGGTTTVADGYFHEHAVAKAFAETGIRAVPAQGIIDFPAPGVQNPTKNIETAKHFLKQWHKGHPLITPAVFAHSPYTCSAQTLLAAKQLATDQGVSLFIHVAETESEHSHIQSPLAASPVKHLDKLGILDQNTICVHCVWIDDEDLDILARTNSGVVTCPQSNLKLASGIAPLGAMLAKNIRVGLGTDGPASNNSLNMFREMDICAKVQKLHALDPVSVSASAVLKAATTGGAEILDLPPATGTLTTGAPADVILLDLNQEQMSPFYSPNLLVYSGGNSIINTVIVNGKVVVKDSQIATIDLEETMAQVRVLARSCA